ETVVEGTTTEYVTYCPVTSGAEGAEEESTKIVTVTSCSNDVCVATTVPAVKTTVSTAAPGGETTVYTTYCPESSVETVESTKIITQVVCSEDKCHETTVEATPSTTSGTVAGETEVTEYVTYCPVTTAPGETVATEVVTSEGSVYVPETVEVTSEGSTYETVVYKTVSKATEGTTEAAETPAGPTTVTTASASGSAVASGSETGVISTYEGSAAVNGASFLALAMIPLAYFF
ncbi:Yeast-form wall Protein 1, partial [Candida tropicalis]